MLSPATAQESEGLTVEVGDCVELTSATERLACFDAQVEAARRQRSSAGEGGSAVEPSARAPAADAPTRAPAVREEPARAAEQVPRSDARRAERDDEPEPVEIVARVTELRPTVPNSYVITLDNGQVWRQTQPLPYRLQPGHEVRIYSAGRWGYRLTNAALRGFIQVERVR